MRRLVPRLVRAAIVVLVVLVLAAGLGWVALDRGWIGGDDGRGWLGYASRGTDPLAGSVATTPTATTGPSSPSTPTASPGTTATGTASAGPSTRSHHHRARPLAGKVVVLDPGHQLGNHRFPAEIDAPVDAGGFTKPCNTTGTATDAGYPEATFTWRVALDVRRLLRRAGARVVLTRHVNSESAWGPCVDARGRIGNPGQPGPTADVRLSIHADGTYASGAHGFHVIAPEDRPGWTEPIAAPSLALARTVRDRMVAAGFVPATYTARRGVEVRGDLGTLNWSKVPAAMIECGNMRDAGDAAVLTSSAGQRRIARALAAALERYLRR
jgi:N-acetylmuramoyl-L-alanine amidase